MTAVDMKITVGSKEQGRIVDFRQPNQCSISEGCGNILGGQPMTPCLAAPP